MTQASEALARAARKARNKILTASPAELGIRPTREFSSVYGVLAEFPIEGGGTATVASLCDGHANFCTDSLVYFEDESEAVGDAAKDFVRAAQVLLDEVTESTDFPAARSDRVRFYLLTYSGIGHVDVDLASDDSTSTLYTSLYDKAIRVINCLSAKGMCFRASDS